MGLQELVNLGNVPSDRLQEGTNHGAVKGLCIPAPQVSGIVEKLCDHASCVRIALLLHFHQTDLADLIDQNEVGVARGEARLAPNDDRSSKTKILGRKQFGVSREDVVEVSLGRQCRFRHRLFRAVWPTDDYMARQAVGIYRDVASGIQQCARPRLLDANCRTIERMRLADAFGRFVEGAA